MNRRSEPDDHQYIPRLVQYLGNLADVTALVPATIGARRTAHLIREAVCRVPILDWVYLYSRPTASWRAGAGPRVTVSPPKRVSLCLRNLRRKKRMSQAALAAKAGFSREYVARPETGHHDPRLSILAKHAEALGVPVTKLLDREER